MSKNFFKLVTIFLLGSILVVFTQCGEPFSTQSKLMFQGNVYGGADALSYNAFEKTVYPITRANCVSCHSNTQPLHAADKVSTAHDAVINGFKVNFANIPASRLVAKLRENHNCWSDCEQNALQMEQAIYQWHDAIADSAPTFTETPTSSLVTSESKTVEQELNDSGNKVKSDTVRINIGPGMLTAPMVRGNDANGEFIWVPNNGQEQTLGANAAGAGKAFFNFTVPTTNTRYRLWALVLAPTGNDNSSFVTIPGRGITNRNFEPAASAKPEWRPLGVDINLPAGSTHTLEISQREDGMKFYKFMISADPAFNGTEVDDFIGVTLKYDISALSKVPGSSFQVDISDYDIYSYKFSNARVVTPGRNIKVKGLKLLINKVYNPQHSTYNAIDLVVSTAAPSVSPYAMVAIKDRGISVDKISFSFDGLEGTDAAPGQTTGGGNGADSLAAFTSSVYVVSRTNCINCHQTQSPRHANDNNLTAHDDLLNRNSVNFTTPENSRLVQKMRERHNCGNATNCDNIAQDFIEAISEWQRSR